MIVAVALKWVDTRPDVDPLRGTVAHDPRGYALSPADQAALELAMLLGETWRAEVWALTAGPPEADQALREALAVGVGRAVRVELAPDVASDMVAKALAAQLQGVDLVVCGDASLDRGSGAVPAFLAAELGWPSALGLVALAAESSALAAQRRLDRGKREVLAVSTPAVVSVEAGCATLRRAALPAVLAAATAPIEVANGPGSRTVSAPVHAVRRKPYRPRPRELAGPDPHSSPRDRVLHLTGAATVHEPPRVIEADAATAADAIIAQLQGWGYLPPAATDS